MLCGLNVVDRSAIETPSHSNDVVCHAGKWISTDKRLRFDRGAINDFLWSREIMTVSATMLNSRHNVAVRVFTVCSSSGPS